MDICASAATVSANIIAQGCERRPDMEDDTSLYFSIKGQIFSIPKPLLNGGYTEEHLNTIASTLRAFRLGACSPWISIFKLKKSTEVLYIHATRGINYISSFFTHNCKPPRSAP